MKKIVGTIFSKTALFLVVVGIIMGVRPVFGESNVIVAVGLITQALVLLSVNLTNEPVRNFVKVLFLDFLIAIASTVVQLGPVIGLIINLVMIFLLVFTLMRDLQTPMYFPFMLTYCFMMATAPVPFEQLPTRLALMACGAGFTMVLQYILNGGKSKRESNASLIKMADIVIAQIDQVLAGRGATEDSLPQIDTNVSAADGQPEVAPDSEISNELGKLARLLNERRKNAFFVSSTVIDKMNIGMSLEKLSSLVNKISCDYDSELKEQTPKANSVSQFLEDLKKSLDLFDDFLKKKVTEEEFAANLDQFEDKYEEASNPLMVQGTHLAEVIRTETSKLMVKREEGRRFYKGRKPKEYRLYHLIRENFRTDSIRMSFALRSALGISLMFFVSQALDLEFGKWLIYTNLAIIQPYASDGGQKLNSRIKGSIIGFLLFVILFGIFKDPASRTMILMIDGYLCSYKKNYFQETIFVTISAMGVAALSDPSTDTFPLQRLLFVLLGGLFATCLNKFVMHLTIEDTVDTLKQRYIDGVKNLEATVFAQKPGAYDENQVANVLVTVSVIGDKLELDNTLVGSKEIEEFIASQRMAINDIMYRGYRTRKKEGTGHGDSI
ncbi:MAG: FUSC family protein [Anaerovoracaceae bacterium]